MTMTLVQTVTVPAGGAVNVTFAAIPATGQDLLVMFSMRAATGMQETLELRFNGIFASQYQWRTLYGDGTSAFSTFSAAAGAVAIGRSEDWTTTAVAFSNGSAYIPNYLSSASKSVSADYVHEDNNTKGWNYIDAGVWNNTAAISTLSLLGNFAQYSTASLYTISTTGATGATVA